VAGDQWRVETELRHFDCAVDLVHVFCHSYPTDDVLA